MTMAGPKEQETDAGRDKARRHLAKSPWCHGSVKGEAMDSGKGL